jgi:antitoxin MazE
MKARLVPIGNSRGIRIPKAILNQCQMSDEVELAVEGTQIILRPSREEPRYGWREAAEQMSAAGDVHLLIPDVFEDDVAVEWQ